MRCLLVAAVAFPLLVGCAGTPCADLPGLRAERDVARADYAALTADGTAPPEVTGPADEELHAIERRVADAEQRCDGR
jgi:hypothetical protein